jgi:hypothetical protein
MPSGKALMAGLMALVLLAGWGAVKSSHAAGWRDDLPQASLLGSGELRWFGLRIYRIALWSGPAPFDPLQAFALELTYQRSISRERLVEVSLDEMRRLFGERYSEAQFKQWQSTMRDAFIDVKPGDQLIGVSLPGIGCRFYNQERLLAEVRDVEFARAFFAIWLDPRSKDAQLRQHLMGAQ